jgi:hypothetical protein
LRAEAEGLPEFSGYVSMVLEACKTKEMLTEFATVARELGLE